MRLTIFLTDFDSILARLRCLSFHLYPNRDQTCGPFCTILVATAASTPSSLTLAQTDNPFRFMDLPVELRLAVLNYTGLVTPAKLVYLGAQGWYLNLEAIKHKRRFRHIAHHSWENPASLFSVSRDFHRYATEVFCKENRFVIEDMKLPTENWHKMKTPKPPLESYFVKSLLPAHNLSYLTSLNLKVDMCKWQWRLVAQRIAPMLTSLRFLTIVERRYKVTNRILNYDFYAGKTINEVRALIDIGVWPTKNVTGSTIERFIVHVDTGARALFASPPDWEPVYFLEKAETSLSDSIRGSIKQPGDGRTRAVAAKARGRGHWIEGIVRASLIEHRLHRM
ncbi:Complex I intermediate-associated protein-like protein CIA30 [Apiospora arundinis]